MKKWLFIFVVFMIGCATPRPIVDSNTSNHEQEHSTKESHNERVIDSTIIDRLREVIVRNDTVYIHDSIYIAKWRDRNATDTIHDTLYINNTDTIIKRVEVEKPIAPFVKKSCIALWSIIGVAILALIVWLVWGFATKKFSLIKLIGLIK